MGIIDKIKEWFFGIDLTKVSRILDRPTPSVERRLAIVEEVLNRACRASKIVANEGNAYLRDFALELNKRMLHMTLLMIQCEPDHMDHFQNRNMFRSVGILLEPQVGGIVSPEQITITETDKEVTLGNYFDLPYYYP